MELVYYKKVVAREAPEDRVLQHPAALRLDAVAELQRQLADEARTRPAAAHAQVDGLAVVVEPLELHERRGLADLAGPVDERRHAVVERSRARREHGLLDLRLDDADALLLHLLELDGLEALDRLDYVRPTRGLAAGRHAVASPEHLVQRVLVVSPHLGGQVGLLEVVFLGVGVQPEHLLAVLLRHLAARDGLLDRRAHLVRRHGYSPRDDRGVLLSGRGLNGRRLGRFRLFVHHVSSCWLVVCGTLKAHINTF